MTVTSSPWKDKNKIRTSTHTYNILLTTFSSPNISYVFTTLQKQPTIFFLNPCNLLTSTISFQKETYRANTHTEKDLMLVPETPTDSSHLLYCTAQQLINSSSRCPSPLSHPSGIPSRPTPNLQGHATSALLPSQSHKVLQEISTISPLP